MWTCLVVSGSLSAPIVRLLITLTKYISCFPPFVFSFQFTELTFPTAERTNRRLRPVSFRQATHAICSPRVAKATTTITDCRPGTGLLQVVSEQPSHHRTAPRKLPTR